MSPSIKNIISVVVGLFAGGTLNMVILGINGTLIPLPPGADVSSPEGLAQSILLFEPVHFLAPFLAHAVGTLVAAWVATRFASAPNLFLSMIPGILFFLAGTYMAVDLKAPLWFEALDLTCAYIPMAWIGYTIVSMGRKKPS
ncbi:MAG: hypothetical protein ACO3O0_00105 [Bacteroidia bacterium]